MHDALNARYVWILRVTIDCEAVTDIIYAKVARYPSESKDRETPVIIVRLNNRANVREGFFILVVSSQVVKRFAVAWIPIRGSVIN